MTGSWGISAQVLHLLKMYLHSEVGFLDFGRLFKEFRFTGYMRLYLLLVSFRYLLFYQFFFAVIVVVVPVVICFSFS